MDPTQPYKTITNTIVEPLTSLDLDKLEQLANDILEQSDGENEDVYLRAIAETARRGVRYIKLTLMLTGEEKKDDK